MEFRQFKASRDNEILVYYIIIKKKYLKQTAHFGYLICLWDKRAKGQSTGQVYGRQACTTYG